MSKCGFCAFAHLISSCRCPPHAEDRLGHCECHLCHHGSPAAGHTLRQVLLPHGLAGKISSLFPGFACGFLWGSSQFCGSGVSLGLINVMLGAKRIELVTPLCHTLTTRSPFGPLLLPLPPSPIIVLRWTSTTCQRFPHCHASCLHLLFSGVLLVLLTHSPCLPLLHFPHSPFSIELC